ncbi:MAG: hypothetical protein LWY06_06830 [Firmicutes bacterium]|nr:hypothetical protein [Bacillota bacterium]
MKKTVLVLLFCIAAAIAAFADTAPVTGIGSTIVPLNSDKIEMVTEQITITPMEGQTGRFGAIRDILIQSEFELKNPTDDDIDLETGFPFPDYNEDPNKYEKPISFEVMIDTNRIRTQTSEAQCGEYGLWYTWKTRIPAKQTVRVITRYRIFPSQAHSDSWTEPYTYSKFVMKTGALWKGNIGQAIVKLQYNPRRYDVYRVFPANGQKRYGQRIWTWNNFKPTEDISFEIWGRDTLKDLFNTDKKHADESRVKASTILPPAKDYSPCNAFDGNPATAWAENAVGDGEGEWIWLNLTQTNNKEEERAFCLEQIGIVNGNAKDNSTYRDYNRVRKAILQFDDGSQKIIELHDNMNTQWFDVNPPAKCKSVKLIIKSVYRGLKYNDTCISDILFRGTYASGDRARNEGRE